MNILLVYPEYPNTFWSFKYSVGFLSRNAALPPLGLLTVASMLPEHWNKKLIDVNVRDLKDGHIDWADMVFISGMIVQKKSAIEIIHRCKNKVVVAGGPLFTTGHENFDGVDHFILNEAESTLPQFLDDLENGCPKHIYESKERPDIKKTPVPLWSLVNMNDYCSMAVQYSRGCPFNCEFCDIVIMNGRVPRTKTPEQMITEFQSLYDSGWRGPVFVVDDNFIGNKNHAKQMLRAILAWQKAHDYPFSLYTEASTNLADDEELMDLMSATNFSKVFLGIETPSMDSLKECGKFQNVSRDLADTCRVIQKHGMQVLGGFIVGFDSDTESIFQTQIDFIQNIGCVVAMVGILTVLPQTRLWHRLKAEDRLLQETTGNNTDDYVNFKPKMGVDVLRDGYRRIVKTIYSPKQYYKRIQTFIRNYNPTVKQKVKPNDIGAFFKSIWRIGVLSKARRYYWKLLAYTLAKKKEAFPVAIELAIYGLHFQRVVEETFN